MVELRSQRQPLRRARKQLSHSIGEFSGTDKIVNLSTNPRWNETKYILLNNLNDMLSLNIKDWNEHRPDSDLGIVHFDLKSLLEDGQQENKLLDAILDGKPRGQLKIDAIYFPVLTPKKLVDGTLDVIPETSE